MWKSNALTEKLKTQYPIIQGPFGGGFSTARLAASVSNLGGLGSFGAHNLKPEEILAKIREIKKLTDKPFAMNLWVSSEDPALREMNEEVYSRIGDGYKKFFEKVQLRVPPCTEHFGEKFEEQVEALIEGQPPVFSFVFGIPNKNILERCRSRGIVTIGAATTVDEATAIESAGVDCVIASGFEAGGHRPSFLKRAEDSLMGSSALLSQVVEKARIPVIVAGGISTAKDIAAARLLGAQGFQLGTAFLACEESGASPIHREAIFSAMAKDTTLSRHYTGRLARFIENDFIRQARAESLEYLPYPAQNYLLSEFKKTASANGRVELAPLYAGQGAPLLKHRTVKDLMASLLISY